VDLFLVGGVDFQACYVNQKAYKNNTNIPTLTQAKCVYAVATQRFIVLRFSFSFCRLILLRNK